MGITCLNVKLRNISWCVYLLPIAVPVAIRKADVLILSCPQVLVNNAIVPFYVGDPKITAINTVAIISLELLVGWFL